MMINFLFHRGNDLTTQFLPDALFFKESILSGRFPLWNPWIFAGMPYFLDPQNFLWYPPNYILLFLPLELGFLILLIGHLMFAAWMIKKGLDKLGIFNKLALLGGLMYVFSPKMISHLEEGNWSLLIANCWLPALYFGLIKNKFWWIVISLSAIIINNLNIGYYAILFAILYFCFLWKRRLLAAKCLLKLFSWVAIFTLPRWLPLILFGNQTVRVGLNEPPLPFWSWTKIIKSLFFPLVNEHPQLQNEEILYLGIIPIFIVVLAIFRFWKERISSLRDLFLIKDFLNFWKIWVTLIFLVALNIKTPFFNLIKWLPGFSLLRITTRPWIFASLFTALFIPLILNKIYQRHKTIVIIIALSILSENLFFGWKLFERRKIAKDNIPESFYQEIVKGGTPVRIYCTSGYLDRLKAQKIGIALLGGNNPIQLTEFVKYLQKAGRYQENSYQPILPPYTVFNQNPQPNAEMLGKTATKFVISPYELLDDSFKLIAEENSYHLYLNKAAIIGFNDHYFSVSLPGKS